VTKIPSVASAVHICRGVAWPILAYPSRSVVVRMRSRGCRIGPSGSLPEGTVLYVRLRGNGAAFGDCRPAQRGSWSFLEGIVNLRTSPMQDSFGGRITSPEGADRFAEGTSSRRVGAVLSARLRATEAGKARVVTRAKARLAGTERWGLALSGFSAPLIAAGMFECQTTGSRRRRDRERTRLARRSMTARILGGGEMTSGSS
jgi:hypothetical protein